VATFILLPLPAVRIFYPVQAISTPERKSSLNSLEKALSIHDFNTDSESCHHGQGRGLWIVLFLAQFSAFVASISAILVVHEDDTQASIARSTVFKIMGAVFTLLSLVGISNSFYRKLSPFFFEIRILNTSSSVLLPPYLPTQTSRYKVRFLPHTHHLHIFFFLWRFP
jgi:hypothetical protein